MSDLFQNQNNDEVKDLKFSTNWNTMPGVLGGGKLNCRYFTTIRLNTGKFTPGTRVKIIVREEVLSYGTVVAVKVKRLSQVDQFEACTDTGYSLADTVNIIRRMYKQDDPIVVILLIEREIL